MPGHNGGTPMVGHSFAYGSCRLDPGSDEETQVVPGELPRVAHALADVERPSRGQRASNALIDRLRLRGLEWIIL